MLSIGILFATSSFGGIGLYPGQLPTNLTGSVAINRLGSVSTVDATRMFVGTNKFSHLFSATLIPSNLLDKGREDATDGTKDKTEENLPDGQSNPDSSFTTPTNSSPLCSVVEQSQAQVNKTSDSIVSTDNTSTDNISTSNTQTKPKTLPSPRFTQASIGDFSWITRLMMRSLVSWFRIPGVVQHQAAIPPFNSTAALVRHRDEANYEVWFRNHLIGSLPTRIHADTLQTRLNRLSQIQDFSAFQLLPKIVDGVPALMAGNRVLFRITEEAKKNTTKSADLLAIEWVNNLRTAFSVPTLSLIQAQTQMYGLTPSSQKLDGLASWYGPYFHGRMTANGETFNENDLTVAHKSLPFNTFLKVRNVATNQSVIVRVNDRGPYIPPRTLDLSKFAARCINAEHKGVVHYEAVIMNPSTPSLTLNATEFRNRLRLRREKPRQIAVVSEF